MPRFVKFQQDSYYSTDEVWVNPDQVCAITEIDSNRCKLYLSCEKEITINGTAEIAIMHLQGHENGQCGAPLEEL